MLQTAPINTPRFDHDAVSLAVLGMLIEEQRTNSIRNSTMQGAVVGAPGTPPTNWQILGPAGITGSIAGVGTEAGIPYVDVRLSGSASLKVIAFEATLQIAAASGQIWTLSPYVRQVAGLMTNITSIKLEIVGSTSGGAGTTDDSLGADLKANIAVGALAGFRPSLAATLADATTAFLRPQITVATNGAAIDITLRIGLPQLEQGAFATSPIPTTNAAVTRSADVAGMSAAGWYNQVAGTLFVDFTYLGQPTGSFSAVVALVGANPDQDFIGITTQQAAGIMGGSVFVGGVGTATAGVSGLTVGSPAKAAMSWDASGQSFVLNGGSPVTAGAQALPTIANLRLMGRVHFQNTMSGWIRRVRYWPWKLTNAQLQAMTA